MTVICSAGLVGYIFYFLFRTKEPRQVRYPEFGISIPQGYGIHGIDVSKYQQTIAWQSVSEMSVQNVRLGFAFMKATEGNGNSDSYFKRNWRKSKEAGLVRGAYHFFIATKDGRKQAENFIDRVRLETGDLPPVLDVEQTFRTSAIKLRKEVKTWLDVVGLYYGVTPIIYTNADFYEKYLRGYFDDYPLWVAHYFQPDQPRISREWSFWQHSEQGRVNGIIPKVDFNVFNGDSTAFKSLLIP